MCIVQDSATKHDIIQKMDLIYGKAFATVVTLSGNDASAALPGIQPHTGRSQYVEAVGDLVLTPTPLPLSYLLELSKWNTRGWTLQEKLLSRRRLYFTYHYVYWQCNKGTFAEIGPGTAPEKNVEANKFEDLNLYSRLASLTIHVYPHEKNDHVFSLYADLVRTYTQRSLSFPLDILHAFSGLANVLRGRFGSTFFGGPPSAGLDRALLWNPVGHTTQGDHNFPTWLWAGWEDSVQYTIDLTCRREKYHFCEAWSRILSDPLSWRPLYTGNEGRGRC